MSHMKIIFIKSFFPLLCSISLFFTCLVPATVFAKEHPVNATCSAFPLIILTTYYQELPIRDTFYLVAVTSSGKRPIFKSSNSSIASVNTYGLVTGKKSGSASITAKIAGAESSCQVQVKPTTIQLNRSHIALENGDSFRLVAAVSTGTFPTFRSSSASRVAVDSNGFVTARKPGTASIKVSVEGTTVLCQVTVNKPSIFLNFYTKSLYRNQRVQLLPTISSTRLPTFQSSKSSVAVVDDAGYITAVKHGSCEIRVSLDGVTKSCKFTVMSPLITLNKNSLTMAAGTSVPLTAAVSSGVVPQWRSSNPNIASVDSSGVVTARQKGKAYIYASEDGTKVSCIITVTN